MVFRCSTRRRRWTAAALAAGVLLGGTLTGCGPARPPADQGSVVLRIGDSFPASHPIDEGGVIPFREYLERHGPAVGLDVEYFANGQMGEQRDMPTLLRKGVLDLAPVSPGYVGSELPMSNVGDLPGLASDPCTGADAVLDAMSPGKTLFEEELRPHGVRPLWVALITDYEVLGTKHPIERPEQAAGRLLRSTGGVADRVVDHVGASGVSMPLGELFEALSRDTVDGTVASPVSIASYKLGEVLDFATSGAQLGSFTVTFSVGEGVWQRLTPDQQRVLREAAAVAQDGVCRKLTEEGETAVAEMRGQGVELVEIGPRQRSAWNAVAEPVQQSWASDLESIGMPGHRVLAEFRRSLAEAEQASRGEN
ncbi:TRAP transporter substrate-binding protein DctP [Saccharopolyspora griseoalba]|uniref:TRAP transporter substrate-binding protein DctP n=1 Tax=Saccharopolyspora griseoalba TaxID=1431848 RepID=A0ABW2LP08_9PSEU